MPSVDHSTGSERAACSSRRLMSSASIEKRAIASHGPPNRTQLLETETRAPLAADTRSSALARRISPAGRSGLTAQGSGGNLPSPNFIYIRVADGANANQLSCLKVDVSILPCPTGRVHTASYQTMRVSPWFVSPIPRVRRCARYPSPTPPPDGVARAGGDDACVKATSEPSKFTSSPRSTIRSASRSRATGSTTKCKSPAPTPRWRYWTAARVPEVGKRLHEDLSSAP